MVVMKFGGSSVGDGERILRAARIVVNQATAGGTPVVVSAMEGVTDALIRAAAHHRSDLLHRTIAELYSRHEEAAQGVAAPGERGTLLTEVRTLVREFENLCSAIQVLGGAHPQGPGRRGLAGRTAFGAAPGCSGAAGGGSGPGHRGHRAHRHQRPPRGGLAAHGAHPPADP